MWDSHLHKLFKNLADYPEMQMWLEGGDDAPDDVELWGTEKTSYTFSDLGAYMEKEDKTRAKKGKGKENKGDNKGKKSNKKNEKKKDKKKDKM
ncbi:hypothetical protein APHAL10511_003931 [Amanita phalloides]|nr:hypothetical protein APHAL10511_003931 [Amanita phalloides]